MDTQNILVNKSVLELMISEITFKALFSDCTYNQDNYVVFDLDKIYNKGVVVTNMLPHTRLFCEKFMFNRILSAKLGVKALPDISGCAPGNGFCENIITRTSVYYMYYLAAYKLYMVAKIQGEYCNEQVFSHEFKVVNGIHPEMYELYIVQMISQIMLVSMLEDESSHKLYIGCDGLARGSTIEHNEVDRDSYAFRIFIWSECVRIYQECKRVLPGLPEIKEITIGTVILFMALTNQAMPKISTSVKSTVNDTENVNVSEVKHDYKGYESSMSVMHCLIGDMSGIFGQYLCSYPMSTDLVNGPRSHVFSNSREFWKAAERIQDSNGITIRTPRSVNSLIAMGNVPDYLRCRRVNSIVLVKGANDHPDVRVSDLFLSYLFRNSMIVKLRISGSINRYCYIIDCSNVLLRTQMVEVLNVLCSIFNSSVGNEIKQNILSIIATSNISNLWYSVLVPDDSVVGGEEV